MGAYERIRRLRDEYEGALDEAERLRDAYHREVLKLHRSGASLREIAENLGISHQRVHQIVSPGAAGARRRRGRASVAAAGTAVLLLAATAFVLGRVTSGEQPAERTAPTPTSRATVLVVTRCPFNTSKPSSLALTAIAGACQRRLDRLAGGEDVRSLFINPETGSIIGVVSPSGSLSSNILVPRNVSLPPGS